MCEHLEISAFTWKRVQGDDDSVVKRLHSLDFEDFSILFSNSNDFKVTWWIDHRPFNKNKQFLP